MTIRKKAESNDIFEDVIKLEDRIETFTIAQIDGQIISWQNRIDQAQAKIDKLNIRKDAAEAL